MSYNLEWMKYLLARVDRSGCFDCRFQAYTVYAIVVRKTHTKISHQPLYYYQKLCTQKTQNDLQFRIEGVHINQSRPRERGLLIILRFKCHQAQTSGYFGFSLMFQLSHLRKGKQYSLPMLKTFPAKMTGYSGSLRLDGLYPNE